MPRTKTKNAGGSGDSGDCCCTCIFVGNVMAELTCISSPFTMGGNSTSLDVFLQMQVSQSFKSVVPLNDPKMAAVVRSLSA